MHRLLLVESEQLFCYTGYTELKRTFNLSQSIFECCASQCISATLELQSQCFINYNYKLRSIKTQPLVQILKLEH